MNNIQVMFSNNTDEWATPQDVFDDLNKEFGFDLDPCATDENHKCDTYYTKDDDGLSMAWGGAESVRESAVLGHFAMGG